MIYILFLDQVKHLLNVRHLKLFDGPASMSFQANFDSCSRGGLHRRTCVFFTSYSRLPHAVTNINFVTGCVGQDVPSRRISGLVHFPES